MEIQFQLSLAEIKEFQRAQIKSGPREIQRKLRSIRIIASIVGIILVGFLYYSSSNLQEWSIILLTCFVLALSLIWIVRHKRAKAMQAYMAQIGSPRITITPELVTVTVSFRRTEHQWLDFKHFGETSHLFLLYVSSWNALIISKRAFASPAECDAFRVLAQAKIQPSIRAFPVVMPG